MFRSGSAILLQIRKFGVLKMDRWIFWPAFASLGIVFALTLACGLPGLVSFLMIPISQLAFAVACIVLLIAAGIFGAKKRPRKAASFLLALIMPVLLWSPINWVADCAHLGLTVWFGAGQLGSSSKPDGSDFEVFDWSVGLAGGPNTFLIHDKTDQIALPTAQHTQPSESEHGFGEDCAGKVRHLVRHYYVCTI
jgi:hypothetical protein